jgi:site-specific recombinase XerD
MTCAESADTVLLPHNATSGPAGTTDRVLLPHKSNTQRRQAPNKGGKYPGETYDPATITALMRGCSSKAPTGIRNRALIAVLYRSGLRISEALALRPADIDVNRGTIRVRNGKGGKARVVGIDDDGLAVLARWTDVRHARGFRSGPLFCTLQGRPVSDRYVRDMLKRVARNAGIDQRVHPHGFRHTHAGELAGENVPMPVIRDQLGHSSVAVTDRYLATIAPAQVIAMGRRRTWQTPA